MLFGTLAGLMWPAITRMPYVAPHPPRMFALLAALVVALPVRDYIVRRRVHPVSIWALRGDPRIVPAARRHRQQRDVASVRRLDDSALKRRTRPQPRTPSVDAASIRICAPRS